MIRAILFLFFFSILSPIYCIAQENLSKHFTKQGIKGSFTLYDYKNSRWICSDTEDSMKETVPASTFKIINLLIALETGVIKDEHDIVKWVGTIDTTIYGYRPNTYKDMTVKEAFEVSAGWVFMELSKKIGRDRYLDYLKRCGYGNGKVSDEADFWNFGPLFISPRNQIEFLIKVHEGRTPFSQRNIDILKSVMTKTSNSEYTLRGKTGWGWYQAIDAGWWVGYVEKADNSYFFATRLTKAREDKNTDFQSARVQITDDILHELGIL